LAGDMVDLAFSPDGSQLASASSLNVVHLWDVASGAELAATVGHTPYISATAFSPDSSTLVVADWDKNVWLWDTAARQELNSSLAVPGVTNTGLRSESGLAYSPDGSLIAISDGFDATLLDAAGSPAGKLDLNGTL